MNLYGGLWKRFGEDMMMLGSVFVGELLKAGWVNVFGCDDGLVVMDKVQISFQLCLFGSTATMDICIGNDERKWRGKLSIKR